MDQKHIDPRALPDRYVMRVDGHCLHPEIKDGDRLEFTTVECGKLGDFVAIFLAPAGLKPGDWHVVVKRLVLDLRKGDLLVPGIGRGVVAEMLNPPKRLGYPAESVLAVHKMLRIVPRQEFHPKVSARELELAAGRGR